MAIFRNLCVRLRFESSKCFCGYSAGVWMRKTGSVQKHLASARKISLPGGREEMSLSGSNDMK
ncbi:MAG: hypothetical protein MUO68_14740 [Desulfobacteraceae bacterium]|nr:hypothetical protein [Desulfobacteraceae bacterium]